MPGSAAPSSVGSSAPGFVQVDDESGAGDLKCVRCQEDTSFADSQKYGRNPFTRVCNQCSSAYRCRMALTKREKMADPNNQSATDQVWAKYTKDEQVAWYRKQKRSSAEKGNGRDIAVSVAQIAEIRRTNRGYRRSHRIVPFGQFHPEQKAKGFSDQVVEQHWKDMLLDPGVEREEHHIDGKRQLCLVLFGQLEKYVDENEGVESQFKRATHMHSMSDLAVKRQRFGEIHADRQSSFRADAAAAPAHLPDAQLLDAEVPQHLLPRVPISNILGSGGPSLFIQDVVRELSLSEETLKEAEAQWEKEAEKFKKAAGANTAKKLKKLDESLEKDLITGRASFDRQVASIESKWKSFGDEKEQFFTALEPMKGAVYEAMKEEVTAKHTAAEQFKGEVLGRLAKAKASLLGDGVSRETLNSSKKVANVAAAAFVAELGAFKIAKHAMAAHQKTIDHEVKRQARQLKQAAPIDSSKEWVPGTDLGEALFKGLLTEEVSETFDLDHCAAVVYSCEDINGLALRMQSQSFFKTQVGFMTKHMQQRSSKMQRVSLTVKAAMRDFDSTLSEGVFPEVALSSPEEVRCGKNTWASAFGIQLARYECYEFIGITTLGVGEAFFVLQGDFAVCGLPLGKLTGSLKDQLEAFASGGKEVTDNITFCYRAVGGETCPIIVVPPASIVQICSKSAMVSTWSFGAHIPSQVELTRKTLEQVLDLWPTAVENPMYKAWWSWLNAT